MGWFVFAAVGKINLTVEIAGTVTRNVYQGIGLYFTRNIMYTLYLHTCLVESTVFSGKGPKFPSKELSRF